MEEHQQSETRDIILAVVITVVILALGAYGVYYFFAPPPPLTLEGVAVKRELERQQEIESEVLSGQETEFQTTCGKGFSGALCRLKHGACDTALGGFFCVLESRDGGDTGDIK